MKNLLKISLLGIVISTTMTFAANEQKFVTIGTGGQTGVYYVMGQSICKLVNRNIKKHGIKCNAPSTGASVVNISGIASGDFDMGVAQSDIQYQAYNGIGKFEGNKIRKLRALFSVYPEPFTVVARSDSGVNTFTDVIGKRVNVGDPGSGTRDTTEIAMKALGLNINDLALKSELKPTEMAAALCDNNLDVITYTVGHPSGAIKEAGASCDSKLISVVGNGIDKLVADNPYYAKAVIPGGTYKSNPRDVNTFGVYATFVASTDTDNETVYQVVKAVFDNFKRFKKLHPAFAHIKKEDMIKNALSAPLHEGAIKYYKEKGWFK